ncbi:hypothetical protein [Candidatus Uabimicrobium sp. HlEnr_7]|uniref:hypothetical protein n=1 Tax=Candidatus Uabimicrobium helgolandensis TaxID=3095367 RepID=UPI0035583D79
MIKPNFVLLQFIVVLSLFCSGCAVSSLSMSLSVGIHKRLEFVSGKRVGKKKSEIKLTTYLKDHSEPGYSNKIIVNIKKKHIAYIKETYKVYKEHKMYEPHPTVSAEFLGIPYVINNFRDLSIAFGTIFDENHYIQGGIFGAILACVFPFISLDEVPKKFLKRDYIGKRNEIRTDIEYTPIGGSLLVSNESGKEVYFKINNYGYLTLDVSHLIQEDLLNDKNKILKFSILGQTSDLKIEQSLINKNRQNLEMTKKSREKKIQNLYLQLKKSDFEQKTLLKELIHLLEKES